MPKAPAAQPQSGLGADLHARRAIAHGKFANCVNELLQNVALSGAIAPGSFSNILATILARHAL